MFRAPSFVREKASLIASGCVMKVSFDFEKKRKKKIASPEIRRDRHDHAELCNAILQHFSFIGKRSRNQRGVVYLCMCYNPAKKKKFVFSSVVTSDVKNARPFRLEI